MQPKNITIKTEKLTIAENEAENVTCVIYRVKPYPQDVYLIVEGNPTQHKDAVVPIDEHRNAAIIEMVVLMTFTKSDNGMKMRCDVAWGENDNIYSSDNVTLNITCKYILRYPMSARSYCYCI